MRRCVCLGQSHDRRSAVPVGLLGRGQRRDLRVLKGHPGWAMRAAWSPDGTQLASGNLDGTIRVWGIPLGLGVAVRPLLQEQSCGHSIQQGKERDHELQSPALQV